MKETNVKHIKSYLQKVKAATKELTKKEHFKDLLRLLYHGEHEIESIFDAISASSEKIILNFPRHNKKHRVSASILYNNIII